jgi:uncharacterized protein with PIN domain
MPDTICRACGMNRGAIDHFLYESGAYGEEIGIGILQAIDCPECYAAYWPGLRWGPQVLVEVN